MGYERYAKELERLKKAGLKREMMGLASAIGRVVTIGGREKLVFCSNNYLGLAGDVRIKEAISQGLQQWGFGGGGSRLICGNTQVHEQLQTRLARLLGKEAVLIFPTGYTTNYAVLTTLAQAGDLIVMDKLVHASLIDGARASAAKVRTWPHGQLDKLKRLLDRGGYEQVFIVTDSLFSMDGDLADLKQLVALKKRYEAVLVVDEAHAFGCIGSQGVGCAAQAGVLDDVDVFVGTFSKALGGAGGFMACSQVLADYMVNASRAFIFTTAIPAVNCIAAAAALDIVAAEADRPERLWANGQYFRRRCQEMGWDTGVSESYIVPIILGSAERAVFTANLLAEQGFLAPAIRPPTVAANSCRLRISLMSEHTREDINRLCAGLEGILRL